MSITDLSKLSGVSKSTVSRVLNNHERVSSEAIEAVQQAVETLGYRKPTSRVGRPKRTPSGVRKRNIVLLFPDTDPRALRTVLSGQLLHGIEEVLRRFGLSLILSGLPSPGRLPPSIENREVDGVLIRGFNANGQEGKSIIDGIGKLPTVHIFEPKVVCPPTWDVVLEDNDAVARIALEYLVGRGRRSLAVLDTLPNHPSLRHRVRSFCNEAQEIGASVRVVPTIDRSAQQVFDDLFAAGPVDGIFYPGSPTPDSNAMLVDLYRSLVARGRKPFEDVELIACLNDQHQLSALDPRLANIDIQAEAVGRAATEALLSRLRNRNEPQRRIAISPRLIDPKALSATE